MKKIIVLLLLCQTYLLSAQKKNKIRDQIAIRLTMENVFSSSRYNYPGKDFTPINNSEYYQFKKMTFAGPDRFSPLTIGVLISYKINKGCKFLFGISEDGAYYGYVLTVKRMYTFAGGDSIFSDQYITNKAGIANTKFPLLFYKSVFNSDSIRLFRSSAFGTNIDFVLGTNVTYQPKENPFIPVSGFGMDSIPLGQGKYMNYTSSMYGLGGVGISYSLGFNFDFKYKSKNIFSITMYYKQGTRVFSRERVNINVSNNIYSYDIYSLGSGIYVQLSKDFTFSKRQK